MNPEADFENCIKTLRNYKQNKGLEQEKTREGAKRDKARDEVSRWHLGSV